MNSTNANPVADIDPLALQAALELLERSGDYRVLSNFKPRDLICKDDGCDKQLLMVLDTETTGLDSGKDKVFELGYVLIEFSPESGKLYRIIDRYSGFEDPGFDLPENIQKITGVATEQVRGHAFDRSKILADIARTDLVLAHNAGFDRKFIEQPFPQFKEKEWVCSMVNGPWEAMGIGSKKLDYLACMVANLYYSAHRALTDAEVLTEVVAKQGVGDESVLKHILDAGLKPSYTIWANSAAFEVKDVLKENGYRWSDGSEPGKFKAWHKSGVADPDAEIEFLASQVYNRPVTIYIDQIAPIDAFSSRFGERQQFDLKPQAKTTLRP